LAEERKVVTALFADIVGSTDLTTSAEPEVIRALFARTFERAKGILEQHGGTVEKFIGDEVMAVFGAPIAHDDDADRAVRAAFAVRESVESPLSLRVGVNTGEVLASSTRGDQSLVTGTPVIAAARLRQGAEPGEILVGELTHNLTRSGVRYGRPRTIQAKGLGPLQAYRAEALTSTVPESRRGVQLASVREAEGKVEDAEALFREALDQLSVGYMGLSLSDARRSYAEFLMRRGRLAEVRDLLELVRDFYQADVVSRRRAPIDELLQRCADLAAET
jgi:class 3 adenylate cyclase